MSKCFIIMKYGKTEQEQKKSKGKFSQLIKPALIATGIIDNPDVDIIRADFESVKGGHLDEHTFKPIAEADIVIADITDANPNVMYELGIRHALKRRGTVIIQEEGNLIPFDLINTFIHSYKYDIDLIEDEIEKLAKIILKRVENDIDSPIHQWLNLENELINSKYSNEMCNDLKLRLEEELKKYAELQTKYLSLGKKAKEFISIESVNNDNALDFYNADKKLNFYGSRIIKRLNNCVAKNNEEDFKNELNLLTENNEYIDERNFIDISMLCYDMNLSAHRVELMEFAYKRYPNHENIRIELIKAYNASPSKRDRDLALQHLIEYFALEKDENNTPIFTEKSKKVTQFTDSILSTIFNVFTSRYEYKELLSIAKSAEDILGIKSFVVLRYKAFALKNLNLNSEAVKYYSEIIRNYPTVYDLSRSSDAFYDIKEYELGYRISELCVLIDYDIAGRYIDLAQDIFRFNYGRKKSREISFYESDRATEIAIIPILFKAITVEPTDEVVEGVIRFLTKRTNRKREIKILEEAEQYQYSTIFKLLDEKREKYDWSIVEYIDKYGNDSFDFSAARNEIIELIHKHMGIE